MTNIKPNSSLIKTSNSNPLDILIIGAGPAGISCASRAKELNMTSLVIDANKVLHTIKQYPKNKILFGVPGHYGKTAEKFVLSMEQNMIDFGIKVVEHTEIKKIKKQNNLFISTSNKNQKIYSKKILIATGINDNPKKLNVPIKNPSIVKYRLHDASKYFEKNIVVIGGGDCAIEAALQLDECKAKVTLCHLKSKFIGNANPSNIQKIETSGVQVLFNCNTESISEQSVNVINSKTGLKKELPAKHVFVFIGKNANSDFLTSIGLKLNTIGKPEFNEHFESSIPGIYIAGDLTNEMLILPAVYHGFKVACRIKKEILKKTKI